MVVTWQTIVSISAVLAAVIAIGKYYNKLYDFVKDQGKQEKEIKSIKAEQEILTYGVLACLKGLREQGCDGAVTDAIGKMEKFLNEKAHA